MDWLKRLFCAHHYEWMRNIYGDEINLSGGKRSLWGCAECGKVQARDDLHDDGNLCGVAGPLPERGCWGLTFDVSRTQRRDGAGSNHKQSAVVALLDRGVRPLVGKRGNDELQTR